MSSSAKIIVQLTRALTPSSLTEALILQPFISSADGLKANRTYYRASFCVLYLIIVCQLQNFKLDFKKSNFVFDCFHRPKTLYSSRNSVRATKASVNCIFHMKDEFFHWIVLLILLPYFSPSTLLCHDTSLLENPVP